MGLMLNTINGIDVSMELSDINLWKSNALDIMTSQCNVGVGDL